MDSNIIRLRTLDGKDLKSLDIRYIDDNGRSKSEIDIDDDIKITSENFIVSLIKCYENVKNDVEKEIFDLSKSSIIFD